MRVDLCKSARIIERLFFHTFVSTDLYVFSETAVTAYQVMMVRTDILIPRSALSHIGAHQKTFFVQGLEGAIYVYFV
ncbi:hypothetical protein A3C18_03945 [Candidatus Kaiserbacteria bacterium RIFCSPHIGHO2_02_FULL_54_11b]|uniref:Uncharacterized protein n=1 Tax=Candidatus Kaiserbacteria bacterium RIFCSPHIGHO2_02_FULL_54_11b TaxID=1798494 RepID=A0A1F6DSF8_9BACT|nr:MAG: hypothetical protein A3C18_03945 [Candidatus Kaiserbacteria bacterium RIFCSPHIGHO2_02_FULL_54_11b]